MFLTREDHRVLLNKQCRTAAEEQFVCVYNRLPVDFERSILNFSKDWHKILPPDKDIFNRLALEYGKEYHLGGHSKDWGFKTEKHWNYTERWQETAKNILACVFHPIKTILDVGCGPGSLVAEFNNNYKEIDAYGVDISNWCVSNPKPGAEGKLHEGLAVAIPAKDYNFELVILCDVLEHQPAEYLDLAISEACRVSNGFIFITIPIPFSGVGTYQWGKEKFVDHYILERADTWRNWFQNKGFVEYPDFYHLALRDQFPFNMGHTNFPILFARR